MNFLTIKSPHRMRYGVIEYGLLLIGLLLIWPILQRLLLNGDPTSGYVDPGIWILVLIGIITFLIGLVISLWALNCLWKVAGLPELSNMVSQFKFLTSWQQLRFYWASFALLLLAMVGCLTAVC